MNGRRLMETAFPSKTRSTFLVAVLFLALSGSGWAEQGIRGRASWGGEVDAGVEVRAYPYRTGTFGPLTGERPAGRTSTATDGTYRLSLTPGRYVVEALQKNVPNGSGRPEAGDLYCLYSGSPVTVVAGSWTPVGLNLVRVPAETRVAGERTGIRGRITRGGEPQEKVYLYVYADPGGGFRGPAHLLQPVRSGAFRVRLPPGRYYLVARKRVRGGAYGPIEIGDLFNFYPQNPVTVTEGTEIELEIPLVERLSQLEEDPMEYQGLPLRVVDGNGKGRAGFYVLAYGDASRSGPPLATSRPTDAEGSTQLPTIPAIPLYLRARSNLGGPLAEGQGYADAVFAGPLTADPPEVRLRVAPKAARP